MGKRILVLLAVALVGMLVIPALASATLVNEYGLHFSGQGNCLTCHQKFSTSSELYVDGSFHGDFATRGISPAVPSSWANFRAAGDIAAKAGTGQVRYTAGGIYSILGLDWVTLGDSSETGNSGTEYLFFQGSDDPTVMPWNLVEGLTWTPEEHWMVGSEAPDKGLYDVTYSCQRCHMLGTTMNGTGKTIPNPAASITPSASTAVQWARQEGTSVNDFMTTASVSYPGLGIQCEQCHGTGQADAAGGHGNTGVKIATGLEAMGNSQVCGQCHGSYTNVPGTLGVYGYTPNLPFYLFGDVNGVSGGASYTKIPTEVEFSASPTAYWMYPNGSNAKGNHYYYSEWAASAHSYRAAYSTASPEAMAYQKAGNGHYQNSMSTGQNCYKCHTGEGYLQSKGDPLAQDLTGITLGQMGQECITCHNGHPDGIGADNVVREPDPAGVRSAAGLSVGNASICEDCHNWQMEVMGTQPKPAPMPTISSHGGASHPQRETLHARSVMLDVPNGKAYMPGAVCEDCHMPKTNKAETRYSHGMKPMLPGDAERWQTMAKYGAGEDSCSSCHPSRTRDELQESIDQWQSDAETQADAVVAAITAAQTRSEFSMTNTSSPGYVLVGRATWNYKAYENDASESVHNPTYIMAGLMKAEAMAKSVGGKFSYVSSSASVKVKKKGHVTGKVVNGDNSVAAGAAVTLYRGSKVLGKTHADENGHFAFTFKVTKTYKNYKVKWARSSSPVTTKSSKTMTIKAVK